MVASLAVVPFVLLLGCGETGGPAAPADVAVIIAAGDLWPGIPVTEGDLAVVEMPAAVAPPGAVTDAAQIVGRTPWERILANEVVLTERLVDPQTGRGSSLLVAPGMRAIGIEAANGRAIRGFVGPDVRFDMLVTITSETGEVDTLPLLQQTRVLAVYGDQTPIYVLEVTPDQAELAAHAMKVGRVTMTVRSDSWFATDPPIRGIVPINIR